MSQIAVSNAPTSSDIYPNRTELTIRHYLTAAALGQLEMVIYYLESEHLEPDITVGGKPTAICYAAMKGNLKLLKYLLDKGARAHQSDALGMTPLHYAALGGCVVCLATLISCGAELNSANESGQTPLALAQYKTQHALCVEFLQRHGATLQPCAPRPQRFH